MHAPAIRLDVAPALMFSDHSQPPDFSGLDEVVALARRYDLRVVADLLTIPTWMARARRRRRSEPLRDRDLAGYASVISQIVSRADPVIRDWEIWNEPDTAQFFDGTPQQYALMLRAAHDAIKSVDPADNVLLGGISARRGQRAGWPRCSPLPARTRARPLISPASTSAAICGGSPPTWAAGGSTSPRLDSAVRCGSPSTAIRRIPRTSTTRATSGARLAGVVSGGLDAHSDRCRRHEVLVTERDNLGGPFASEGVLGGNVADPPAADPEMVTKPAFAVVQGDRGLLAAPRT